MFSRCVCDRSRLAKLNPATVLSHNNKLYVKKGKGVNINLTEQIASVFVTVAYSCSIKFSHSEGFYNFFFPKTKGESEL